MVGDSTSHPLAPPRRVFNLDEEDGVTHALFREFALSEQAYHTRTVRWPTDLRRLPDLGPAIASGRNDYSESAIARLRSVLCHVRVMEGVAHVALAAQQKKALDEVEGELRSLIPRPPVRGDDDRSSVFRFWYHAPVGATTIARRIAVPDWQQIRANYPSPTRGELGDLMTGWRPDAKGRLLLWHGAPGTGKTYALRALTWQWRGWCDPHYIIDPERFFGERPDYMLEVLLDRADDPDVFSGDGAPRFEGGRRNEGRWRLLILEDTGELLATDAKERQGQGLSRLLNLVDGVIGQGLRVVVLVTGNEPLRRLHPAISRPGRCAGVTEFRPFGAEQARGWLDARGCSQDLPGGGALADLYATLSGRRRARETVVGFAAATM
jgi:hypothetical protein